MNKDFRTMASFVAIFAIIGVALFGVSDAQGLKKKVTVTGQLHQKVECVQAPCNPAPLAASLKGTMVKKRSWFMGRSHKYNFTTDEQGKFALNLPKGTYTVNLPRKAKAPKRNQPVEIVTDQYACDSQRFTVKKTAVDLSILCYPTTGAGTPGEVAPSLTVTSGQEFTLLVGQSATLSGSNITLKLNGIGGNGCGAITNNNPEALCTMEYHPTVLFDLTVDGKTYTSTDLGQLPPEAAGYVKPMTEQDTDLKTFAKFTLYADPNTSK